MKRSAILKGLLDLAVWSASAHNHDLFFWSTNEFSVLAKDAPSGCKIQNARHLTDVGDYLKLLRP